MDHAHGPHAHGPHAALSDEADPLYRPLGGLDPWVAAPVDDAAWDHAIHRLRDLRRDRPDWAAMVDRGALLAGAHHSGALDGLYAVDTDLVHSLLLGGSSLASVDGEARPHVRANADAFRLAGAVEISESAVRRIHEVACRPQLTHLVEVEDRLQDHVLAAGDYKHHPNHIRGASGHWHPTAPVAQVAHEMAAFVELAGSAAYSGLHPAARAAFLHHALLYVQPFADGNGRVARALASRPLSRATSLPFLPGAAEAWPAGAAQQVAFVQRTTIALIDFLAASPPKSPALDRWRAQEAAGAAVRQRLGSGVAEALDHYCARPDRRADLSAAVVVAAETVTVRVPPAAVEEVIGVEAHPEADDGRVVLTAAEAQLRLDVWAGTDLAPWLDRVVAILGLRVAAELE